MPRYQIKTSVGFLPTEIKWHLKKGVMNGTVVVIQDFCTRRCYVRNEIHEGCSRSLKGPSAYTADLCDICIYFLIQEGRICSYCCGEEKREMLSGHNASSYGHEFDSSEGLWG